ncbi:synembryn-A-like [Paramacrobiotus metropolitanus]|uniref:synembryn-A-like n=1 Tax=Paramacrobiotus metropolitanus TaxID=2943436 RepID=UPI002445AC58|nr:synembryn-A-like [Paramacrobiotus metropolitanus]
MNSDDITVIESGSVADLNRILQEFNARHTSTFTFSGFDAIGKKRLGEILARKLSAAEFADAHSSSLEFLRLVARDKTDLENLINDDLLHILAVRARLTKELQGTLPAEHEIGVTTEAQKVLCNLVFHSASGQRYFSREEIVDVLMSRISSNKEAARWPLENQLLDMKLLFIISILCADTRVHLRNDLRAVQDLCVTVTMLASSSASGAAAEGSLVNSVLCEILKVLFNLVCNMSPTNLTLGEELDFVTLGNTCRELLISTTSPDVKKHVINLLTVVKKFGYNQLVIPLDDGSPGAVPYENFDLQAVSVILKYLDEKLSGVTVGNGSGRSVDDSLAPVLCALTEAAKTVPIIRKYLKTQILPPLRDVHNRPEVGSSLRNKICRLLTVPLVSVRDSAGDFLYILCKNNVNRLIKYTGYGNAAGWLADRGMMGLPRAHEEQMEDTEDSETEEYEQHKHTIDPITGAVKVEGPNPMEGMSEEQKEYYAHELALALDKLIKKGDIKPAAIGPDGRPQMIDDVLKYREEMLKQQNPKPKPQPDDEDG